MFKVLQNTWALFFGFALISLGHGLQGTLIGVRSVLEGFSFFASGLIIAGYYNSKFFTTCWSHKSFCSFSIACLYRYIITLSICASLFMDVYTNINWFKSCWNLCDHGELVK